MKKTYIIVIICLVIVLVVSNFCWYILYQKEQEKIKNALIPTLAEDYFARQLTLTKLKKVNIEYPRYEDISYEKELEKNFKLVLPCY